MSTTSHTDRIQRESLIVHALRTSISQLNLLCHSGLGCNHLTLTTLTVWRFGVHSSKVQKQHKKNHFVCVVSIAEYSYCYLIVSLFFVLPITNHTRRINLQIQSSYKSKVSQKYASLLYIANVYFILIFFIASKTYDTVHNQSTSFST